jgi:hypothetical protein
MTEDNFRSCVSRCYYAAYSKVTHELATTAGLTMPQGREGPPSHLKVSGEKLEDDWLSIVVVPTRPGIRASDHAQIMSKIERELRAQGDDNVLLVPALED